MDSKAASKGRVLVMDDEPLVLTVVGKMLEYLGYEVCLARDGQSALKLFRERTAVGTQPQVAILDWIMPGGIGGKEVNRELRRLDPNVKVILSSGFGDPGLSEQSEFTASIAKPYEMQTLRQLMEKLLPGR